MSTAILLNSVEDAQACVRDRLNIGKILISTHSSVDTYLREHHKIECYFLSRFISNKEELDLSIRSIDRVESILKELDFSVGGILNREFGFKIDYFQPLYSYLGKYHYSACLSLHNCLRRFIDSYAIKKLYFYNCSLTKFFSPSVDIERFLTAILPEVELQRLEGSSNVNFHYKPSNFLAKLIWNFRKRPAWTLLKILKVISEDKKYSCSNTGRKTILLYDDLYEIEFIKRHLRDYNVVYYRFPDIYPIGFNANNQHIDLSETFAFKIKEDGDPISRIFIENIKNDFLKNIPSYLRGLCRLREIHRKFNISLGVWGSPPITAMKTLVFEYLKSENIKILGSQHGGLYADSYVPQHLDSDFSRSDYYLSYGFTQEDLQRTYPDKKISCKIIPVGKMKLINKAKRTRKIDILFPLTMNESILKNGIRINEFELTNWQIKILEYLNSLTHLSIYIKPLPYFDYQNCSFIPVLKRMRNLKVVRSVYLMRFLQRYSPEVVIMEYPSQPLYECLSLDTEIFLMGNKIVPFEKKALEELRKRVHYSEDIDSFIRMIDEYLMTKQPRKRDDTFLNHYVKKDNTKENILTQIESLINER